jgi:hypothetical protein
MTLEQRGESLQRAHLLTRGKDPADRNANRPALASHDTKSEPPAVRETRFGAAAGPGRTGTQCQECAESAHGDHDRPNAELEASRASQAPGRCKHQSSSREVVPLVVEI